MAPLSLLGSPEFELLSVGHRLTVTDRVVVRMSRLPATGGARCMESVRTSNTRWPKDWMSLSAAAGNPASNAPCSSYAGIGGLSSEANATILLCAVASKKSTDDAWRVP